MATVGLEKYKSLVRKLWPQGWAWRGSDGTTFQQFLDSLANEPCRIEERGLDFLEEMDPNTTFEMLDNWERLLGIPDECTPPGDPSLFERRVRVLQKLTTGGGQSPAFFQLIAQQLGYDAQIIDIQNFRDFRVGISRVGEALSNSTDPNGEVNEAGWAYTWRVKAPAETVRRFKVGQNTVGERLVNRSNETLECVIRRFSPAHTTVLFSFTD